MKKGQKSIRVQRREWLAGKDMDRREFARVTGQEFGTVCTWFRSDRTPRRPYLKSVLAVFPDWPHK